MPRALTPLPPRPLWVPDHLRRPAASLPPPLWVPRRLRRPRPSWRPRVPLLFGPGAKLVDATTGKRLVNATTGKRQAVVTTAEDCECCGVDVRCVVCQTTNATVTFADVVPCATGCLGQLELTGTLSGTFFLTYSPSVPFPCRYVYTGASPIAYSVYEDEGCGGGHCPGSPLDVLNIELFRVPSGASEGLWGLSANLAGTNIIAFSSDSFLPPDCFSGTDTIPCDHFCWTKTVSNIAECDENTGVDDDCDLALHDYYWSGGTATITVGTG